MLMQLLIIIISIKLYMNCGIIAVVHGGHNIEHKWITFLSTAQKHNRQNFEHNRSRPNSNYT